MTANWCGVSLGGHENVLRSDVMSIQCDTNQCDHIADSANI